MQAKRGGVMPRTASKRLETAQRNSRRRCSHFSIVRVRKLCRYLGLQKPWVQLALAISFSLILVLAISRRNALTAALSAEQAGVLMLGVASADIVPSETVWLSGFASRVSAPSSTALLTPDAPLRVKALALWETGARDTAAASRAQLVLLTFDLVGMDRALSDELFRALRAAHGLPRARVRLVFSHTHSGPVVGQNLFPLAPADASERAKAARYARFLVRAAVRAAGRALAPARARAVRAFFAKGELDLSVNRRQVVEAGFKPGDARGDIDREVPALWFRAARGGGALVAGAFGFAAHATVLTRSAGYSGDYPAAAAARLEGTFPGATWLFLPGCGGDLNVYPRGNATLLRAHAAALAAAVRAAVADAPRALQAPRVRARAKHVALPFRRTLARADLRRLARSRERASAVAAAALLQTLPGQGRTPETYPLPVAAAQVGPVRFVFLGGEPTVDYAARLRGDAGADWVVGYTDDVMGYLGSAQVLREGLREGSDRAALYYGLPCAWDPAVEDIVVREAGALIQAVASDVDGDVGFNATVRNPG